MLYGQVPWSDSASTGASLPTEEIAFIEKELEGRIWPVSFLWSFRRRQESRSRQREPQRTSPFTLGALECAASCFIGLPRGYLAWTVARDDRGGKTMISRLDHILTISLVLGIFPVLLQGCGEKPAPAAIEKALVRSDDIKKRLEEPISPLPGARFIQSQGGQTTREPMRFTFNGESQRNGEYGRIQLGKSFAMDVASLDFSQLRQEALKIAPGHLNSTMKADFDRLKKWDDVASAAKDHQDALLSEFMAATILHFADSFSGLGLRLQPLSDWYDQAGPGCSYVLTDPEGANVIDITIWFGIPQARAYVTLAYIAHYNGKPSEVRFAEASPWGTHRTP
jgi:hypothetical protein